MDMSDLRPTQEEKPELGRVSWRLQGPPRVMQSRDDFAGKRKAINGNMGPATSLNASNSNARCAHYGCDSGGLSGLLERTARRADLLSLWESPSQTSYKSVPSTVHKRQNDQSDAQLGEQLGLDFVEAKYTVGDMFVYCPQRGLRPIRLGTIVMSPSVTWTLLCPRPDRMHCSIQNMVT